MSEITDKIEAGLLWRRQVREVLKVFKWEHKEFEWIEQKGLIQSTFHLRGPVELIQELSKRVWDALA